MKPKVDYTLRFKACKLVSLTLILTLLFTTLNVGAIAQVVLNLGYGTPSAGSSLEISWNQMDDADHYEYSVRNTTTDELIYDHEPTTFRSFTISGKYLIANNSYRVWVGAYRSEDVDGWPPSTHTAEWEFTVPDDTCYHEGKTYQDIIKKVYKSISDTQHRATTTYDLCCYDCDEVLKERQVLEENDDHFLDENGDCKLCDYTHSCPHTQSEVDVENSGYLTEDEEYHIYFETGHYVCANANCGKEIKPYYYETEEEHTFKNNTCKYCGYTKSEPLSITVAREQQAAVVGESISATVTTKGGSGSFDYAWEVICDGTVVDRTDYSMSTDYSYITAKAGNWQFKVYVKDTVSKEEVTATTSNITVSEATCNHANKENETIDTRYIKTSDTKHEIRTYYNVVCNDCGDVLSEGNYSSEIVDHVVGSSGQCVCGYASPTDTCEHTTSRPVQINQRTEQYDEKWHRVITTYQDVCANDDCGIILVAGRDEMEMVAHTFDSNGQCACGYVLPTDQCDHAPIETLVETDYVEIDGTTHECIRKFHYECECGQVNYDEETQSFDPHVYEDRICKLCGFENPCDHADFQKVISSVVEDDKNSNSTHFVVTTYTKTCECGAVNPTPIVRTTVPCSFTKSAGVQAKHESQGHQYFDRCACGNATVNGKFKNYLSSCATCQQQYGDDALAKGTYNSSRVEELQQMLGFTGNAIDGDFGGNTESAVKEFQKKHGLPVTGIVDDATWAKLVSESKQDEKETPSEQETTVQPSVSPDEKQAVMDDSIDFIERSATGKDSIYDQFFTDELRKEITVLSEGKAASSYDFIAGDAAAIISTAQADYYVDTLMKQCAGVNSDSKTISVSPEDFSLMCSFIGLDDAIINKMLEKWTVDRWTDKNGDMILDRTPALKINIKKDEFAKEMEKYEFKGLEYLGTSIEIGSYLWDCLYDYHVYSTAFDGEASTMIDSAKNRMYDSDLSAAELASMYIESCETIEGRIAYIMLKNANIADFARDEAFDAMLSNPSLKLAYEGSTLINDLLFGTTDLLEANHGTYWSMQMVDELHDELVDCIERYQNDSSEANYNDCLGTYSLYTTYLISAYNGVLESIDVHAGSWAGKDLTADERKLVEQWKLFMEWYADDIEYALKDNSIDAIMKQLEEMN